MPEAGKISPGQLLALLFFAVFPTSLVFLPGAATKIAQQDSWLTFVLLTLWGMLSASLQSTLAQRFPQKTIIQYAPLVLGKWLGKLAAFAVIFFFFTVNLFVIRQFAEFIVNTFMSRTPLAVFIFASVVLSTWTVFLGLEVLARANEVLFPLTLFVLAFIFAFSLPDLDLKKLLPLFENGPLPVVKSTYPGLLFFSEFFVVNLLFPFLNQPAQGQKTALKAAAWVGILHILSTITILAVFGPTLTARFLCPFLDLARYISLAGIVERQEALVATVWVFAGVLKVTLYFYSTALSLAQFLGLKSYHPLIFPLAAAFIFLPLFIFQSIPQLCTLLEEKTSPLLTPISFGLPLLLLVAAALRRQRE